MLRPAPGQINDGRDEFFTFGGIRSVSLKNTEGPHKLVAAPRALHDHNSYTLSRMLAWSPMNHMQLSTRTLWRALIAFPAASRPVGPRFPAQRPRRYYFDAKQKHAQLTPQKMHFQRVRRHIHRLFLESRASTWAHPEPMLEGDTLVFREATPISMRISDRS